MSNGNGNGGTIVHFRKTLGVCIVVTVAINTPSFLVLQSHDEDLASIEQTLDKIQGNRYRDVDAERDRQLDLAKFELVDFRFQTNEANIKLCLEHIRNKIDE